MEFVKIEALPTVSALGAEVVLTDFAHDALPADWLANLDAAQVHGIKIIPWLWPQGWTWNGTSWQIDSQARLFLKTVANHPALLAVYTLHEPYWNECDTCGYTTNQQQALYTQLKAIANVPLYTEVGSMAYWTAQGAETAFADGICDYCGAWYYPFVEGGYERQELIARLQAELAVAQQQAPNSKIVWLMQSYAQSSPTNLRMLTATEMEDLAAIVYSKDVAGAMWYTWHFDGLYDDFLSNHPELFPVVKAIYQEQVLPAKNIHCVYLPVIWRN